MRNASRLPVTATASFEDAQADSAAGQAGNAAPAQPLTIARPHPGSMLLAHTLFCLENTMRVVQPLVVGLAINDLLAASYCGLLVFVTLRLAYMVIGAVRQMYCARVFTKVCSDLSTNRTADQRSIAADPCNITAGSAVSLEHVDLFEHSIPMLFQAVFSIVGSLLMLGWYSTMLVPLCLLLILPASLLHSAYNRRKLLLWTRFHVEDECEANIVASSDAAAAKRRLNALSHWRVKLADVEGVNNVLKELFVLGLLATTLVQFCTRGTTPADGLPQAGDIFAVACYVHLFILGLDALLPNLPRLAKLRRVS